MPPAAAEPTFLLLLLIATAAFAQPSADDVLARVHAAYAGKRYHGVTRNRGETTETFFSPADGVKFVSKYPARTETLWGKPDCLQSYWHEQHNVTRVCTSVCAASAQALPLRIVCHFSLGQPLLLPAGATRSPALTTEPLNGRPMYVVSDLTDFDQQSRLWIDPQSYVVRRFDIQFVNNVWRTVDFTTVEIGAKVTADDVRFAPPFSIERFTREHGAISTMLVNALVFLASFVFCRITDHPGVTAAAWRKIGITAAIGYGVVAVLAVLLAGVKGGHPPPILLAIIAAFWWTELLILAVAILAGAHFAARRAH